jgi:uncharacterized protein YbaP (TraB family)
MRGQTRAAWLVLLALAGACRHEVSPAAAKGSSADPWASQAPASTPAPTGDPAQTPTSDPWAVADHADAPPSLAERKRHVEAACPTVTVPYFYRIEKAGKVSHILGTRHVSVSLDKFPGAVHDTLRASKLVVFEVAPDDDNHSEAKELDLPDVLGDKTWAHYVALVGGDTAHVVEHASAATALVGMMLMYEDPGAQLEGEIEQVAAGANIPMRGLETSAFQDGVLEKLLDVRMLRASIDTTADRAELESDSREDLAGYCGGIDESPGMDEEDRKEMMAAGYTKAELDAYDEQLVYSRNADWIPKLQKLFEKPGVFVAVGAGHLQGPRSVIALLTAKGYKATRIK